MSLDKETMDVHRKLAIAYFNSTWDLMDVKDRTEEQEIKMIHMAHASRFHWGEIGTTLEFSRGEWQISRVYSLCGMGESALYHAEKALEYCLEGSHGDFDLAFAYEAIARAYKTLKDTDHKEHFIEKATKAAESIAKQGDREYFLSELATL